MKDFDILLRRLLDAGVRFANEPSRLAHIHHGQVSDTFLAFENPRRRKPTDTMVDWSIEDGERLWRGVEASIDRSVPMRRFVRGPLHLHHDDEFSAYGRGLLVADRPATYESQRIMELPPWINPTA